MSEEKNIWTGSSSHVINLGAYVACALFSLIIMVVDIWFVWPVAPTPVFWGLVSTMLVAIGFGLVKYVQNRSRIYEITTERIKLTTGIFSRRVEEMELYRVKDITWLEPFFLRLFGMGNIVLTTNDATDPTLTLEAVPNSTELRDQLRQSVEDCRQRKRVRLAELE